LVARSLCRSRKTSIRSTVNLKRRDLVPSSSTWYTCGGGLLVHAVPDRTLEDETVERLQLDAVQVDVEEPFEACKDAASVGAGRCVRCDQEDMAKRLEDKLRDDALDAARSGEERLSLSEH
jgi:hypothetical protein